MGARRAFSIASLIVAGLVSLSAAWRPVTPPALTRGDLRWLSRVTFGLNTATLARYRTLGREKFLDEQLHPPLNDPADLVAAIAVMPVIQQTAEARITANRLEQQRINTLAIEDEKQAASQDSYNPKPPRTANAKIAITGQRKGARPDVRGHATTGRITP